MSDKKDLFCASCHFIFTTGTVGMESKVVEEEVREEAELLLEIGFDEGGEKRDKTEVEKLEGEKGI